MDCEEDRVDRNIPHVLLFTSDPVYVEQIKGIIIRMGGTVKAILLWIPCLRCCYLERSNSMTSKTRSVSPARELRSDLGFPHVSPWEIPHARPALLAVSSITQFDIIITPSSIIDITDLEAYPPAIYRGKLIANRERDVLHCI